MITYPGPDTGEDQPILDLSGGPELTYAAADGSMLDQSTDGHKPSMLLCLTMLCPETQ